MADITLSKAVRSNLLNLQSTADSLSKTQEKLATGKKVNSALDNPNNFFTSSALNSRAGDLASLLDSTSNGIKTIEAADNGLSAITKTVETLQATARQARQDKSFKAQSFSIDESATGSLSFKGGAVGNSAVNIGIQADEVPAVTSSVAPSGVYTPPQAANQSLLNSTADYSAPPAAVQSEITSGAVYTAPTAATAAEINATAYDAPDAAVQSVVVADKAYDAPAAAVQSTLTTGVFADIDVSAAPTDSVTFDVSLGGTSKTITLDQNGAGAGGPGGDFVYDIEEAVDEINHQLQSASGGGALGVTASVDGNQIVLTADAAGSDSVAISTFVENGAAAFGTLDDNAGTQALTASANFAPIDLTNDAGDGLNFEVSLNGESHSISLTRADDGDADNILSSTEALVKINADLAGSGIAATEAGGKLVFTATDTDSTANISIGEVTLVEGGGAGTSNASIADIGAAEGETTSVTGSVNGAAAETRSVTIEHTTSGGATTTVDVALDSTHDTAEKAADAINTALAGAGGAIAADYASGKIKASQVGGELKISGAEDGTNSVDVGGANTDVFDTFGTGRPADVATGVEAVDRTFSINDGSNSYDVTLTADNAGTAAEAAQAIRDQIAGSSLTVEVGDFGGGTDNVVNITGSADGSDSVTFANHSVTGDNDQALVFGGGRADETAIAGTTNSVTIGDGSNTLTVELTQANAGDAAAAIATINTAIANDADLAGKIKAEAGVTSNNINLVGTAEGTTTPSITPGTGANATFGAGFLPATVAQSSERTVQIGTDNGSGVETLDIKLTDSDNDVTAAVATINAAIAADTRFAGKVTAEVNGNRIDLKGQADGSNDVSVVSDPANATFGVGAAPASAASTAVNREITIGDGTNSIDVTLTSANAGDAAAAAATINAAIAGDTDLAGTIQASASGGELTLTGNSDGTNSVSASGANVTDVFGSSRVTTSGAERKHEAKTVDALVAEINNHADLEGKVRASNDNGKLRIENLSTEDLDLGGVSSTSGKVDGSSGEAEVGGNTVRKGLVNQFNELRNQLDKLADDASYNGINLLRGDKLKLTFNETATSTIEIQAKDSSGAKTSVDVNTLDIDAATNSLFDDDDQIDAQLNKLGDALNVLRSHSSDFGSNLSIVQNRQDFTKEMINTLETGAANLTLADTNEEAANLLALQTRQQLSSTALSLSSQADQAVLRLF